MIFKVRIKSELDENYEMMGLNVRIGPANIENPDLELWRPLVLAPGEIYIWETEDAKNEYAPFSEIILKSGLAKIPFHGDAKRKLVERIVIETKTRKDWIKKFCPYRDHRYVCTFTNLTESIWNYTGQYIGTIEVRPGIPKRLSLSPLNIHLTPWKEIEIRYHRTADSLTGKLFPRAAKWFGIKKRSEKELKELEKDIENALKKHRLTSVTVTPEMAIDDNLLKEKKSLLAAK